MSVGCKYLLPSPLIFAGKVDGGGVGAVREQGLRGGGRGVARAPGVADGRPGQAPDGLPRAGDHGGDLSVGQPRHDQSHCGQALQHGEVSSSDTVGCCCQHKKVYSYSEEDTRLIVMTQFKASSVNSKERKMNLLVPTLLVKAKTRVFER